MFIKKIVPFKILNQYANVILVNKTYTIYRDDSEKNGLVNFTLAKIDIEFYNENKKPIDKGLFFIDDLPINNNISLISPSDLTTPDAIIMFDTQHQKIFDEIKNKYGLTYYDDTYEIDEKLCFSYIEIDGYYHY